MIKPAVCTRGTATFFLKHFREGLYVHVAVRAPFNLKKDFFLKCFNVNWCMRPDDMITLPKVYIVIFLKRGGFIFQLREQNSAPNRPATPEGNSLACIIIHIFWKISPCQSLLCDFFHKSLIRAVEKIK